MRHNLFFMHITINVIFDGFCYYIIIILKFIENNLLLFLLISY
jgi:hypothetical protein